MKVKALMDFNYSKYDDIENLISKSKVEKGKVFAGDILVVSNKDGKYLLGDNPSKLVAVEKIEEIKKDIERIEKLRNEMDKIEEEVLEEIVPRRRKR